MPPAPTTTKTLTASTNGTLIKSPEEFKLDDSLSNGKPTSTITNGVSNGSASKRRGASESKNGKNEVAKSEKEVDMHGHAGVEMVWRNVILFAYLHTAALYGGYLWVSGQVMWQTFVWGKLINLNYVDSLNQIRPKLIFNLPCLIIL